MVSFNLISNDLANSSELLDFGFLGLISLLFALIPYFFFFMDLVLELLDLGERDCY